MEHLLIALGIVSVLVSGVTLFLVYRLRGSIDGRLARLAPEEEDYPPLRGRRVTIARERELPDALEAMMERRTLKHPLA